MHKHYLLTGLLLSATLRVLAQSPPTERLTEKILAADGSPTLILFKGQEKRYSAEEAPKALREQLALSQDEQLVRTKAETDALGFTHEKYQQYYRGVKVEHAVYSTHAKAGIIESFSGTIRHPNQLDIVPKISASSALDLALAFVGAKEYMWEFPQEEAELKRQQNNSAATYKPQGELVLVADAASRETAKPKLVLAWKFDIYAQNPRSRAYIYVDARTGAVVLRDAILKHIAASFETRYSGTRTVETEANPGGGYRLRDLSRGNGIITLNSQRASSTAGAVDFTDNDNNWTAAEYNNANFDNAAGDAHFGAAATFDYWRNVHGRNSWDNNGGQLRNYVHFGQGYDNAGWDGSQMIYGDGSAVFRPLTSLDVAGHEIGHGVCQATANLFYGGESGALNEGFSDIWGACIEQYTTAALGLTKSTWLIGEEVVRFGPALRSMSDPRSLGQPAYYQGQNWYRGSNESDRVHINSGVLNHWFFITSQGESGTNEGGNFYCVTGIGINSAARIAYRAESVYLTANSSYFDARSYTIKAAQDIFGSNSAEVAAVTGAWFAVGIGANTPALSINGPTALCGSGTFTSSLQGQGYTYTWSASPASAFTISSGTGPTFTTASVGNGQGTITLQITGGACPLTGTKQVNLGAPATPTVMIENQSDCDRVAGILITNYDPSLTYTTRATGNTRAVYAVNYRGWFQLMGPPQGYNGYSGYTITASNSCGTTSTVNAYVQFGTCYRYRYSTYPNPANEEVSVYQDDSPTETTSQSASARTTVAATETKTVAPITVRLYDGHGRLRLEKQGNTQTGVRLATATLPTGLYVLHVLQDEQIVSRQQLQVQH